MNGDGKNLPGRFSVFANGDKKRSIGRHIDHCNLEIQGEIQGRDP